MSWAIGAVGLYGDFALARGLPGGPVAVALTGPLWAPPIVLMGTFLLLRFPNGQLMSPRWRKVEWLAASAVVVVSVVILLSPGTLADEGYPQLRNPLGVESLRKVLTFLKPLLFLIPATILASAVSLVPRFRR